LPTGPLRARAVRQQLVVSRAQALSHGMTDAGLRAQCRAGRWQRLLTGVYAAFTGAPSWESWCWAALLYAGDGAVLSHETAATLHGFGRQGRALPVHVTIPERRRVRAHAHVRVHRCRHVEAMRHPVLEPARTRVEPTVLDLVDDSASLDEAIAVVARACQQRVTTSERILASSQHRGRLRWRHPLAPVLAAVADGAHSALEVRYGRDVERPHGLPPGRRQRPSHRGGARQWSDVAYEEWRTLVELDGRLGHDGVGERWRDAERDNAASLVGERTLRFGWRDVAARPCLVAQQVGAVLRLSGWGGRPRPCGPGCVAPG
jgi:hypothetical protein